MVKSGKEGKEFSSCINRTIKIVKYVEARWTHHETRGKKSNDWALLKELEQGDDSDSGEKEGQ